MIFSERSLYAVARLSVCRLSVTLVHTTQAAKIGSRPQLADMHGRSKICLVFSITVLQTDFETSYSEFDFLKKTFQLNVRYMLLRDGLRGFPPQTAQRKPLSLTN